MSRRKPRFRRVLLKLSGEALVGEDSFGIDPGVLRSVAEEIVGIYEHGVELGVVIGGGNIFRGLRAPSYGVERVTGDFMGMLATTINALALGEALKGKGARAKVLTAIAMPEIADSFTHEQALRHIGDGCIVLFAAGTGNPYFTTDTAAALRAAEIHAEVLLKATKVDGVYNADPQRKHNAKLLRRISYKRIMQDDLRIMDMSAISLSMEQSIPIIVFNLRIKKNLERIVFGEEIGTLITGEGV
jgi:uridylate kinase